MSARNVGRLVLKDCWLMGLPTAAYTAAAFVALALSAGAPGARAAGITLALNVMIGASFHVTLGPVLGERERKTLGFVMSLPLTPREVVLAKLMSSFLLLLVPVTVSAAALIPAGGLGAYLAPVVLAWFLLFAIVMATAIVGESLGWTIAVLGGLIFFIGNVVLQVAPSLAWVVQFADDLARGGATLAVTLVAELSAIALAAAITMGLQGRKTSFV